MRVTQSLALKLMVTMCAAFAATSLVAYFLVTMQMKKIIDRSQSEYYSERLSSIRDLIERQYQRLEATGMRETYEQDFKETTLHTLEHLYYKSPHPDEMLYIVDRKGAIVLHPHLRPGDTSLTSSDPVRRIIASGEEGEFDYADERGIKSWSMAKSFKPWSWFVVYSLPLDAKYADVRALQFRVLEIMIFITALVFLMLFIIITAFTRPILRLAKASRAMADGHMEEAIDTRGRDEVGILARSFAYLRDTVRQRMEDLREKNRELEEQIGQRVRAESALRESEERLRSTIESLDDLLFVLDRERRFIDFQQPSKAGALYMRPSQFIGKRLNEIGLPPEVLMMFEQALDKVERTGGVQSWDYALPYITGPRWFSATASQRHDDAGASAGVTIVARDITDRKAMEEELRKAKEDLERQNEELQKLDKVKDSLIQDVTHELKTPVAKQEMQIEILKASLGDLPHESPIGRALQILESSSRRQEMVIRNLLDLSRLESGRRAFSVGPVRLDVIIHQTLEDYRSYIEEYGFEISTSLEPLTVEADGEMLAHVFSNIVNNALKYRKIGTRGKLDICIRREGDRAAVTIRDNGIGISPENLARVFDRFYQVTPSSEGIGVGLNITRMILEGMGGSVKLESAGPGHGVTAVILLAIA